MVSSPAGYRSSAHGLGDDGTGFLGWWRGHAVTLGLSGVRALDAAGLYANYERNRANQDL